MGSDRPKQYLSLGSLTLLERSVACLLQDARVERVLVVVAPGDPRAHALQLPSRCRIAGVGAATRPRSVLQGLRELAREAQPEDRVLVHDAARPCLPAADLTALLDAAGAEEEGGLLAAPMGDTIKRSQDGRACATVDRSHLWRALTPQLFPLRLLLDALSRPSDPDGFTDESSAVEALGLRPRIVPGSAENIKVTVARDLELAEAILRRQGRW